MPKIVPLNVSETADASRQSVPASSSISIAIPISRMAYSSDGEVVGFDWGAAPVGLNAESSTFVEAGQIRSFEYYAGLVRPDLKDAGEKISKLGDVRLASSRLPDDVEMRVGLVTVAAKSFDAQRQRDVERALTDVQPKFVPYAFGALPIRPIGDSISHGAHGLVGTLIVEPKGSTDAGDGRLKLPEIKFETEKRAAENESTTTPDPIPSATVREHVLVYQDGLNLHYGGQPVTDCPTCDDSYDWGEKAVSYKAEPFVLRLGHDTPQLLTHKWSDINLNESTFPPHFFASPEPATPTLAMQANEENVIRVVHPWGRARQRAFVIHGASYDDLFPGFGSPHSALLGPGKSLTAAFVSPAIPGTYLYRDGPQHIFAAGVWGHMNVTCDRPIDKDGKCPTEPPEAENNAPADKK